MRDRLEGIVGRARLGIPPASRARYSTPMRSTYAIALLLWTLAPAAEGAARLQPRPHGERVEVEGSRIRILDGDTAEIRWSATDVETVRVLGVDTAELFLRPPPDGRLSARGAEARGFARGAFATSERIELLRSRRLDRYDRTLGYFFLDGRNYSVLVIEAGLATETVTRFGDNGFPREARQVREAAARSQGRQSDRFQPQSRTARLGTRPRSP